MKVYPTVVNGVKLIIPEIFYDERGCFLENFNQQKFFEKVGVEGVFVQENFSISKKNVIRGLHFQHKFPQGKLVNVLYGCILDVVVDLRVASPTFKNILTICLKSDNRQLWIPPGFAHGFKVLSRQAKVSYKVSQYWFPKDEHVILWNDPELSIDWKTSTTPILSPKDQSGLPFSEVPKFV